MTDEGRRGDPGQSDAAPSRAVWVATLGRFSVRSGGVHVPDQWERRHCGDMLKALLVAPNMRLGRDELVDRFWSAAKDGRATLRGGLKELRDLLRPRSGAAPGSPALRVEDVEDSVALVARLRDERDAPVLPREDWYDAAAFERAARRGGDEGAIQAALALYGGPFLPHDLAIDVDWEGRPVQATRERLQRMAIDVRLRAAGTAAGRGDSAGVETELRMVLEEDPAHEAAAARLMETLVDRGDVAPALRVYGATERALGELGLSPSGELAAARARLNAGRGRPAVPPTHHGRGACGPTNLPPAASRLVGRQREFNDALTSLTSARLLTLTGVGGCGKTRLALTVAEEARTLFPDGVWLVELAPVADPGVLAGVLASAVGARATRDQSPRDALAGTLLGRRSLVVLDNCEHLVAACAALAGDLLHACPDLTILATSRERLGVAGEIVHPIAPLTVPPSDTVGPSELERYEAPRLLVDRAAALGVRLDLNERTAPIVAAIVRRLDGLPLAIELAAARLPAFSTPEVLSLLDDRFGLLAPGSRSAPGRQRTLFETLTWSYDLLNEDERRWLRRLSAFAGGWTREEAEWVCGEGHDGEDAGSRPASASASAPISADPLTSLVEKSFVQAWDAMEERRRFAMLETVRAYASDRLVESGEAAATRLRHAACMVALAEREAAGLTGPRQEQCLDRIGGMHDNVRAALAWARERGEPESGLRLASAVWRFWLIRGPLAEGRAWLDALLALDGPVDLAVRAGACEAAGKLAGAQGDQASAEALLARALALWGSLGDEGGIARSRAGLAGVALARGDLDDARAGYEAAIALAATGDARDSAAWHNNLGVTHVRRGDLDGAERAWRACLPLFEDLDDKRSVAIILDNLGGIATVRGDLEAAFALHGRALAIKRGIKDTRGIGVTLHNMGSIAFKDGDYRRARDLFAQGFAALEEVGYKGKAAMALASLADAARAVGDTIAAREGYARSLTLAEESGDRGLVAHCLDGVAVLLAARGWRGDVMSAARLFGVAHELREASGTASVALDMEEMYKHDVETVREALGADAFATAWADGRAMGVADAIAVALEGCNVP